MLSGSGSLQQFGGRYPNCLGDFTAVVISLLIFSTASNKEMRIESLRPVWRCNPVCEWEQFVGVGNESFLV